MIAVLLPFLFSFLPFLAVAGKSQPPSDSFLSPRRQLNNVPDYSDCSQSHACQAYLYGVPTKFKAPGLNVLEAHKIANNKGEDGRVIIMDTDLYEDHDDLPQSEKQFGHYIAEHTTNIAGILVGKDNGWGVLGIAAKARVVTWKSAFTHTVRGELEAGDVIVCATRGGEMRGPGCYIPTMDDKHYGKDLTDYLTLKKGVHVVQSAGNSGCDTGDGLSHHKREDDETKRTKTVVYDNGVILVGGRDPGVQSGHIWYSNYGPRVALNGWGFYVTTTHKDNTYDTDFSGTSSASPIVGGCVVLLQSVARAREIGNIAPRDMRRILFHSGDDVPNDENKYIGRQPDLVKALGLLDPSLGPVRRRHRTIVFAETRNTF